MSQSQSFFRTLLNHPWIVDGTGAEFEPEPKDSKASTETAKFLRQSSIKELSDFVSAAISLKKSLSRSESQEQEDITWKSKFRSLDEESTRKNVAISKSTILLSRNKLHRDWEQQTLKFQSIDENEDTDK